MSFRLRLALLFVATLIVIQLVTGVLMYEVARRGVIAEGERQLAAGADSVARQLDDMSTRVADNVHVLALDYALRTAIAQRDEGTVLSALRNHGRRIGADRMMLIGLDGLIRSDTSDTSDVGHAFPYEDLVEASLDHPAAAVVALGSKAYWMIVVPVYAPSPIALIAAAIPVDDALLKHLQHLSALPNMLELITRNAAGHWSDIALGGERAVAPQVTSHGDLPMEPTVVTVNGYEYVALAKRLRESQRSAPVAVLLSYSLDDALQPYRSVTLAWGILLALGLAGGLVGAMLIARSVARPIEILAETARRIESGDYTPAPRMRERGEVGQLAAAFANMTHAIAEREEQIRHQARHDAVTTLPNRQAAEETIGRSLDESPQATGVLLMIGLARLPEIIQTLGHTIGDRVMRDAGARLRALADGASVARATDTQFSLWLIGAGIEEALILARRALDALVTPYREADISLDTAPAVGIALSPVHGRDAGALLRRAEVALIAATGAEHPIVVYNPTTDPHRPERLSLMGDLRKAVGADELLLSYQPKLHLASGVIDSVEALLRWRHPVRGLLPPDLFIGLAERTGNIREVSRWVIDRSIAQAADWTRRGHPLRVAINLSARDLDDDRLPDLIADRLAAHAVQPACVLLELTESAVMNDPETAIRVFGRLADQGVDLAIDDFGIGQSSFAYLRRLPVREIKIDRLFTQSLALDSSDRELVRSMVELGHRLGYRVTAEGVETVEALEYLRTIGCDHVQGYHIAKAMAPDAVEAMLQRMAAGTLAGVSA
ncbi:MAG: EAL domain-containing protein [Dokdonella sp.]|uniref:putative bifunctional diguanylate cyclase/phosphodiesterase n=1 Tax=Dokdonella sp. TaxID=2291710 RepID=UPI003263BABF